MSPLWPETIYVGLFPGHCWLQRGKAAPQEFPSPLGSDPTALLQALETMLSEQAKPLRKGSRLQITVSDSIASIATMPWQEALRRPVEIDSYASICFEKLGMTVGADWVMRAEFRHFGGVGLAYALPRDWLEALIALVQSKGLGLRSVQPLSAAAYCKQRFKNKTGSTLLLMQEVNRSSAMVYGKDGLLGYDVEPIARSINETQRRLLRRVGSGFSDIARVVCWSTDVSETAMPNDIVKACFLEIEPVRLSHDFWN